MVYQIRNKKANYLLRVKRDKFVLYEKGDVDRDGNVYNETKVVDADYSENIKLYIVTDLQPTNDRAIIIKESASGDNGYVIDNGRLQQSITINGELLASSNDELMKIESSILKLQGKVVEFIPKKFKSLNYSNKFFIEKFNPTYSNASDVSMPFTMTLQEYREVNVSYSENDITNLAAEFVKTVLGMNETDEIIYNTVKNITYRDTKITNTINSVLKPLGLSINARVKTTSKVWIDENGEEQTSLQESKTRGISINTQNKKITNAALYAATPFAPLLVPLKWMKLIEVKEASNDKTMVITVDGVSRVVYERDYVVYDVSDGTKLYEYVGGSNS